ncbi:hypothetical protein CBR_g26257 [Chara braunii]|uniref:Uncharacterized protein n=1 Tax=Chara braunii TaxID=69332 RepID=A0A388L7P7_CHABU|nr:hypothetical protein CBR_g26257 [Chara braunii]|eukprot:GBG78223.1 hypothetical protein CBR_g26257 [Chara braunii]
MLAAKRQELEERKKLQTEGERLQRQLREQKAKQTATKEQLALLAETVLHTKQELAAMNKTLQKVETHQYEFEGIWNTFLQKSATDVDHYIKAYIGKLDDHINETFTPAVIENICGSGGGGGDGDRDGDDGDRKKKGVQQEEIGEVRKIKVKVSWTYTDKKEESVLHWIAAIESYVYGQRIPYWDRVLMATSCMADDATSFAPAGEGDKEEVVAEEEEVADVEEEDPAPRGVVAKVATTWVEGAMVPHKVVEVPTPHGVEEEARGMEIGISHIHPIPVCQKASLGKSWGLQKRSSKIEKLLTSVSNVVTPTTLFPTARITSVIVTYLDVGTDLQEKIKNAYPTDPVYGAMLKHVQEAPQEFPNYRVTQGLLFERTDVHDRLYSAERTELHEVEQSVHDLQDRLGDSPDQAQMVPARGRSTLSIGGGDKLSLSHDEFPATGAFAEFHSSHPAVHGVNGKGESATAVWTHNVEVLNAAAQSLLAALESHGSLVAQSCALHEQRGVAIGFGNAQVAGMMSKALFNKAKARHRQNIVPYLKHPFDGEQPVANNAYRIVECASTYYKHLFTSETSTTNQQQLEAARTSLLEALPALLSSQQRNLLESPLTPADLLKALHDMDDNKTPGLHAFPKEFWLHFWDVFATDFIDYVNVVFHKESFGDMMGQGVTTLLYKKGD